MTTPTNDQRIALSAIPGKYATPDPAKVCKLPKPLKKDSPKGKCHECGGYHGLPAVHLDYEGHAEITLDLCEIDPLWTWEPMGYAEDGTPSIIVRGDRELVLWGWLTVHGKRLPAVGTAPIKNDAEKELIGDLLRNGAMRFGIGTNLWSKSEASDTGRADQDQPKTTTAKGPPEGATLPEAWVKRINAKVDEVAKAIGEEPWTLQDHVLRWCDGLHGAANPWFLTKEQATALGKWLDEYQAAGAPPPIGPEEDIPL